MADRQHARLPFDAYRGREAFLFASYSHDDTDTVYLELTRLRNDGFNVWFDEGISPGHVWSDELAEKIESCALFLLFVSSRSVASENCIRETQFALNRQRPILAVHIEETQLPRGLELSIGDRQAIVKPRLSEEAYRRKLDEALSGHLSRRGPNTDENRRANRPPEPHIAATRSPRAGAAGGKRGRLAAGIGVIVLIAAGAFWLSGRDARWVREEGIPQIQAFVTASDWQSAYRLARRVEAVESDNSPLAELWPRFSWISTIRTDPPGARIDLRPYGAGEDAWETLGIAPLEDVRIPFGLSEARAELDGFGVVHRTLGNGAFGVTTKIDIESIKLDPRGELPQGKVRVPGWRETVAGEPTEFGDFFLGRFEVTNLEFKAFVDAGGYQQRALWEHAFVRDGQPISWKEAMSLFTDKTGRPGPSTWEVGDYADGQSNHPVTGVSWYEAAAYAKFVGQSLPTYHQWQRAYSPGILAWMLPASNVDGTGPEPVGRPGTMSWSGVYDMAGNVREWCFNAIGERRIALGGGWNDTPYAVLETLPVEPLDRSPINGFRLAIARDRGEVATRGNQPLVKREARDVMSIEAVSDEEFAIIRAMHDYDESPLDPAVDSTLEQRSWIRERVTFDAAYGSEKMILYLYLPRSGSPPYQTLLYWPQIMARQLSSIDDYGVVFDFLLRSGRAVAFPMLKGTLERDGGGRLVPAIGTAARQELEIHRINDLRRSIDYLETRVDIDAGALGLVAESWGAGNSPRALALEPRLRVAVFHVPVVFEAVFAMPRAIGQVPFLPRVGVPTLMLSGELDSVVPLTEAAKPLFELLGTREPHKRHVVMMGGHYVPRDVFVRETLDWLDTYMGRPPS